jgi:hypothetical protein
MGREVNGHIFYSIYHICLPLLHNCRHPLQNLGYIELAVGYQILRQQVKP